MLMHGLQTAHHKLRLFANLNPQSERNSNNLHKTALLYYFLSVYYIECQTHDALIATTAALGVPGVLHFHHLNCAVPPFANGMPNCPNAERPL